MQGGRAALALMAALLVGCAPAHQQAAPRHVPDWAPCTYPDGILQELQPWKKAITGIALVQVNGREVLTPRKGTHYTASLERPYAGDIPLRLTIHEPGESILLDVGKRYVLVLANGPAAGLHTVVMAGFGAFEITDSGLQVDCHPDASTKLDMAPDMLGADLTARLRLLP
jgi:hypothetical protein